MDIGRAGSALRYNASRIKVNPNPINMAIKQARVVFQSPCAEALPTRTL